MATTKYSPVIVGQPSIVVAKKSKKQKEFVETIGKIVREAKADGHLDLFVAGLEGNLSFEEAKKQIEEKGKSRNL